ncbi:hypothetical protein GYMLUDRAFT_86072 [Collybiopsis luxurians FD-317 M1]|uniref:Enoyl reductase (ER) domain-containing protein n=1 Tax=Collybiopsis luxurians FD-317 M1 TaxID=944289 RepID=A0A0D0BUJ2_9AGAR|nr:hypothetical protein GYMLUDRAFT_86072 [Collybiopsis luxurians FD-317 M1]
MDSSFQKALFLERIDGAFYEGTRPIPKPGPGELLVKVKAFALNPADWKIQKIDMQVMKSFPHVVGNDTAGDVEEIGGGVQGWNKGDRVFFQAYFGHSDYAGFQEYTLVPADLAVKIPANITYEQASTIPVACMAPAYGLLAPAPLGAGLANATLDPQSDFSGFSALVVGGATSVGQFAIQLLKYLGFGQILTYASGHHSAFLKSLGATDIIDRKKYSLDQLPEVVGQLKSAPIKIVYDAVGNPETQNASNACTPDGETLVSSLPKQVVDFGNSGKKFFGPVAIAQFPDPEGSLREFGKVICGRLEEWVRKGVIVPSPVEVLPTGFTAIIGGLNRLENNQVSGVKLVGRPESA